nr:hypothetical protein [Actinomycetota bacterium]
MDCPSCGHEAERGSRECALCGVRFDGWQPRRGREDLTAPAWDTSLLDELTVPRPVALSPRRFLLLVALVIVLAGTIRGIGLRWSDRAGDAATATLVGHGLMSGGSDSREVKGALSRLDPIFREVEAEGRTHGVTFALEDLEQYFEPAARPLDPATAVRN